MLEAFLAASGAGTTVDLPNLLLTQGPLGLIVVLFFTDQIVTGRSYRKLEVELERRRTQEERLIVMAERNARLVTDALEVLRDVSDTLDATLKPARQPARRATRRSP